MRIEVERNLVTIEHKNYRHHFYRVTPESEQLLCHAVTSRTMGKQVRDTEIFMGEPDKVYGILTSPTLMPGALPKALFPQALMVQLLNAIKS